MALTELIKEILTLEDIFKETVLLIAERNLLDVKLKEICQHIKIAVTDEDWLAIELETDTLDLEFQELNSKQQVLIDKAKLLGYNI